MPDPDSDDDEIATRAAERRQRGFHYAEWLGDDLFDHGLNIPSSLSLPPLSASAGSDADADADADTAASYVPVADERAWQASSSSDAAEAQHAGFSMRSSDPSTVPEFGGAPMALPTYVDANGAPLTAHANDFEPPTRSLQSGPAELPMTVNVSMFPAAPNAEPQAWPSVPTSAPQQGIRPQGAYPQPQASWW